MSSSALVNPAFVATLRFSLLDLVRSRWLPLVVALLAIAAGAGIFAGQLGLIEQQRIALAFTAPLARLLAVALVTVLVVAAIAREADEGSRQLALSVALSRPAWVGARWLGFSLMATVTALACAVPLALLAPVGHGPAIVAWTATLALELCVVASLALTVALAIGQVAVATLATLAVYAAARLIGVILLLNARGPMTGDGGPAAWFDVPLQVLGALLPRLDLFAQTAWLLDHEVPALVAPITRIAFPAMAQAGLYCALLLAAAIFDFSRREL